MEDVGPPPVPFVAAAAGVLAPLLATLNAATPAAAAAHVARSVCRRAERSLWRAEQTDGARYLNRLSDFFFVLARALNAEDDFPEDQWRGLSSSDGG